MSQTKELTSEELEQVKAAIVKELTEKPPTIGLVGVSGVGKSSIINTLFKTNLATSNTVACTKEFDTVALKIERGIAEGQTAKLQIIDAPGLGEDIDKDPQYLQMYKDNLRQCDVILWVQTAKNRAIAIDQAYLMELKEFHSKMVFGLNQVDLLEPMNWDTKINLPSVEQVKSIDEIIEDRKNKMSKIVGKEVAFIPFSSKTRYNLQELFTTLLHHCPKERIFIFDGLKNFKHDDFLPEEVRKELEKTNKNKLTFKIK
jgi:small GTP-binding protein